MEPAPSASAWPHNPSSSVSRLPIFGKPPSQVLVARRGDFVVRRRIRFPGNAGKTTGSRFGGSNDPDRLPTGAADPGLVVGQCCLEACRYLGLLLARIALQMETDVF